LAAAGCGAGCFDSCFGSDAGDSLKAGAMGV
jgi:hypothetical protein